MDFLTEPWPQITKSIKAASTRVAVTPYLNGHAFEMLWLRKSTDMLVVDASIANVKSGLTNPHEIEKFYKKGVRCYSLRGLHAKVYRADRDLFVGSANASTHSAEYLIEACLRVRNDDVVADFEKWLGQQVLEPIKLSDIRELKKVYKSPKWMKEANKHTHNASSWITYVGQYDESGDLDRFRSAVADRYGIDEDAVYPISYQASFGGKIGAEARAGDEVFVLDHDDGNVVAYFPMRLIERQKTSGSRYKIALEDNDVEPVSFTKFMRAAKSAGLTLTSTGRINRKITPDVAAALRKLWR